MTIIERLRERKVFNPYEFYGVQPYLWQRSHDQRGVTPAAWCVTKRGRNLGREWYDHGARWFTYAGAIGSAEYKEALADAVRWASVEFQIDYWLRDPFGGYGPAAFVKRRMVELVPGARWKRVWAQA